MATIVVVSFPTLANYSSLSSLFVALFDSFLNLPVIISLLTQLLVKLALQI